MASLVAHEIIATKPAIKIMRVFIINPIVFSRLSAVPQEEAMPNGTHPITPFGENQWRPRLDVSL
jgi:hypothetical protein